MRTILLWMARNRFLKQHLPRLWFARRAVRRFMPGEEIEDALDAAEQFRPLGIGILLTHLGENLASLEQAVMDGTLEARQGDRHLRDAPNLRSLIATFLDATLDRFANLALLVE